MAEKRDPMQVLWVDRDGSSRKALEPVFESAGCSARFVDSASEALTSLEELWPAMIFATLDVPATGGTALISTLKKNRYLADVPLVALAPTSAPMVVGELAGAGADDFLPAPPNPAQVAAKVAAVKSARARPFALRTPVTKTVLVADPDPTLRAVLARHLDRRGYQVLDVATALEVLQAVKKSAPAIDLCLVSAAGLEQPLTSLAGKVRRLPSGAKLPMVALSTRAEAPSLAKELSPLDVAVVPARDSSVHTLLAAVNDQLFRGKDTRSSERRPFFAACEFRRSYVPDWSTGFAFDLSKEGLAVRSLTPAPVGTTIEFRLVMGSGPGLSGKAQVAWTNDFNLRDAGTFPLGMGLQFSELSAENRAAITQAWVSAAA